MSLSNKARQAIRWYFNAKIGHKTIKEVREVMTEMWGEDVMQEIKEWAKS